MSRASRASQKSPSKKIAVQTPGQSANKLVNELEKELDRMREENNQIRFAKDLRERDFENIMFENA